MTLEYAPPPTYSQDDPDDSQPDCSAVPQDPQILIIPTVDTINFQKGFLGADGERAAIEGELQIKDAEGGRWAKITVSLLTVERAYLREIELNTSEVVLFSSSQSASSTLPSILPFAIPLTPDTPQSIRTPHSSLSHTLTATLYPSVPLLPSFSKTITVQTRRFTSHTFAPVTHPETHSLDDPTRIEVQVPRTTFRAGEPIPVYVTIPPPKRELVVDQGLRLRNVRVELIRFVKVKRLEVEDDTIDTEGDFLSDTEEHYEIYPSASDGPSMASSSTVIEKPSKASSSKDPDTQPLIGASYRTVVAHSGASCRFHSSKSVRLRFILHQRSPSGSPPDFQVDLPSGEYGHPENDAEWAPITQTTLLHAVKFRLNVHVSFVDMSTHTERFSTTSIPVVIIAPPAVLPEVDGWVDAAYQKKHDRPPTKTVRQEDAETSAPHYEGEAGPSFLQNSAPPPFEERDAPPPFFSYTAESSTSVRLPTFLESEAEIIVPPREDHSNPQHSVPPLTIFGEGIDFGFPPSLQFDGHSEDMQRSSTPPPTLEMASRDANLTDLTDINEAGRAMEVLGLALERHEEMGGHHPPPPPPAMDDPSDPPPSIDSHFRAPGASHHQSLPPHPSSPPPHTPHVQSTEPAALQTTARSPSTRQNQETSHGHAPPPYLIPENGGEHEQVSHPPPYMG